ncbi:putative quinol monooxygenase [Lacihabitans lacunae]|uniref:Quinol monooxygenase n=1 Tax=Lacihabitans lacunae TaxID=1028214 RepID=A0ABV7YVX9_9BACT
MVTLIAKLEAKPGKEDETLTALQILVEKTTQEPGNIDYILHQEKENKCAFVFYERFKDMEAFDAHSASSYIQEFRASAAELLERPGQITFLERK